jgi:hypothetical protein
VRPQLCPQRRSDGVPSDLRASAALLCFDGWWLLCPAGGRGGGAVQTSVERAGSPPALVVETYDLHSTEI